MASEYVAFGDHIVHLKNQLNEYADLDNRGRYFVDEFTVNTLYEKIIETIENNDEFTITNGNTNDDGDNSEDGDGDGDGDGDETQSFSIVKWTNYDKNETRELTFYHYNDGSEWRLYSKETKSEMEALQEQERKRQEEWSRQHDEWRAETIRVNKENDKIHAKKLQEWRNYCNDDLISFYAKKSNCTTLEKCNLKPNNMKCQDCRNILYELEQHTHFAFCEIVKGGHGNRRRCRHSKSAKLIINPNQMQ